MNLSPVAQQRLTSLSTILDLKDTAHQGGMVKVVGGQHDRRVFASASHRPAMAWIKSAFLPSLRAKNREIKALLVQTATLALKEHDISNDTFLRIKKAINPKYGTPLSIAKVRKLVQEVVNQSNAKEMKHFNSKEKAAIKVAKVFGKIGLKNIAQKLKKAVNEGVFEGPLNAREQRRAQELREHFLERENEVGRYTNFDDSDDDEFEQVPVPPKVIDEDLPPSPKRQEPLTPFDQVVRQVKEINANTDMKPQIFLRPVQRETNPEEHPGGQLPPPLNLPIKRVLIQELESRIATNNTEPENEVGEGEWEGEEEYFDEEDLSRLVQVLNSEYPTAPLVFSGQDVSSDQLIDTIRNLDEDRSLVTPDIDSEQTVEDNPELSSTEEPTPLTPEQQEEIELKNGLAAWLKEDSMAEVKQGLQNFLNEGKNPN